MSQSEAPELNSPSSPAGKGTIEMAAAETPGTELVPNYRRAALLQNLNKLRGLIPIVSGVLRMVDHGAVQALAQLLPLLGGPAPAGAAEPMRAVPDEGMLELQQDNRELRLQLQGQTVQLKRLEEQIERLREAADQDRAGNLALAETVRSMGGLVKGFGITLAILLVLLIAAAGILLAHARP